MRLKSLLIALALVLSAVGAAQTAEASLADCGADRICLWGNLDFNWLIGDRTTGGGLWPLSGSADNQMDSWANKSSFAAAGYDVSNGSGDCQTFAGSSNDNNVAPWNSDEVSSWRTDHGC